MANVVPSKWAALSHGVLWGEEILKSGCELRMETVGGSMLPALRAGDIVIVRPACASDVTVGDVIVFRQGNTLVAHRLIRKSGANGATVLMTKGDFKRDYDELLPADKVLGKVITVERQGRVCNLTSPSQKAAAWLRVHIIPAIPWFLPLLRTLRNEARQAFGR
jgi:signal peptidase I